MVLQHVLARLRELGDVILVFGARQAGEHVAVVHEPRQHIPHALLLRQVVGELAQLLHPLRDADRQLAVQELRVDQALLRRGRGPFPVREQVDQRHRRAALLRKVADRPVERGAEASGGDRRDAGLAMAAGPAALAQQRGGAAEEHAVVLQFKLLIRFPMSFCPSTPALRARGWGLTHFRLI